MFRCVCCLAVFCPVFGLLGPKNGLLARLRHKTYKFTQNHAKAKILALHFFLNCVNPTYPGQCSSVGARRVDSMSLQCRACARQGSLHRLPVALSPPRQAPLSVATGRKRRCVDPWRGLKVWLSSCAKNSVSVQRYGVAILFGGLRIFARLVSTLNQGFLWTNLGLGACAAHLDAIVLGVGSGACVLGR